MSDLAKSIQCDRCDLKAWLRFKKADNSPFYVCENSHFTNIDDEKGGGNGQRRPANNQSGGEWKTASRVSKVPCPCCGAEIIVDVHASSLGVVKKKQHAPTLKEYAGVEESTEGIPDDDIPF